MLPCGLVGVQATQPTSCKDTCVLLRLQSLFAAGVQVEGLIHFDSGVEVLLQWDEHIANVCHQVEDILEMANATNPGLLA